jgi:peptidoglycan/xylan/chitin deacetylase (PgdA/CDA1 family)
MRRVLSLGLAIASLLGAETRKCSGTLYLTIDTGSMSQAERIRSILKKHNVKATFFVAQERTVNEDKTLDPSWAPYWKGLVADGHSFGSHTFRHGKLTGDTPDGRVRYLVNGKTELLTKAALCEELRRSDTRFQELTGRKLDGFWRAPGGHTTPKALEYAASCGYRHVDWAPAGFLGDELSSEKFPNSVLLKRALAKLKDGDIMMMHLGIWSRKDPWAPELEPLLTGLEAKGFCFATIGSKYGR